MADSKMTTISKNKLGPDFLVIGAAKAGTTWLFHMLNQHPDIRLPDFKEIHYFDQDTFTQTHRMQNYTKMCSNLRGGQLKAAKLWAMAKTLNPDLYFSIFSEIKENQSRITGDITPAYATLGNDAIKFARSVCPNTKLIFILRNPIYRTWSQIRFEHFVVNGKPLEQFYLDGLVSRLTSQSVASRSSYVETIVNWEKYFGDNAVSVLFYDEIIDAPAELIRKVCNILEAEFCPEVFGRKMKQVVNTSPDIPIPAQIKAILTDLYQHDIRWLSQRYGGYARKWAAEVEYILSGT